MGKNTEQVPDGAIPLHDLGTVDDPSQGGHGIPDVPSDGKVGEVL